MEWRPFAAVFVQNTLKEFVAKHDFNADAKVNRSSSPAFRYKPSDQEVQSQHLRFLELQKRVASQRKAIRQRDEEYSEQRKRKLEQEVLRSLRERQSRSQSNKEARGLGQRRAFRSFRQNEKSHDLSGIFTLTGADGGPQSSRLRHNSSREGVVSLKPVYPSEKELQTNISLPVIALRDSHTTTQLPTNRARPPRLGV